jgi:hypothetical protein
LVVSRARFAVSIQTGTRALAASWGKKLARVTSLPKLHIGVIEMGREEASLRAHVDASHIWIVWTAAALRGNPYNVLCRVLDVAGFTMHAVLCVDLQTVGAVIRLNELIHGRRTETPFRSSVGAQVYVYRYGNVPKRKVSGLILFVVRIR